MAERFAGMTHERTQSCCCRLNIELSGLRTGTQIVSLFHCGMFDTRERCLSQVTERTHELACTNQELAVEVEHRREAEEALQKATDAAVGAAEAKSQWLANMAHEIRTPLNGIVNCIELCRDTPLNAEQREYMELVRGSEELPA